jgi:two-component system, cell cycle response regulator
MHFCPEQFAIVVADDSPLYRKLLESTLAENGYRVFVAQNGQEALALVDQQQPAVLITDWEMPQLSGLELCAQIRRSRASLTYAILLTSHAEKEQIIQGLAAGADDYLTKPFHAGELLARVGVGIRIVQLHREIQKKNRLLEELALTDPLTGLANRRAFEEWATRQLAGARRHSFSLWLVMADLDHFKRINDQFGHEAGDLVLQAFANLSKAHTRSADMCARLGGEEFVFALSHVSENGVRIAVERLRSEFAEVKLSDSRAIAVSASFGVAGLHPGAETLQQLLREADAALYRAKERGRNRTEFACAQL